MKKSPCFFSSSTFVMMTALMNSAGLTESITRVNFHPLMNLNQEIIEIL
jgi:hypothetical protein